MSESVESVIADMRRSAGERPDTPYFAAVSDWANRLERAAAPQPKDARPSPEGVGDGCKCVCHSMKAGMVHSHACCVSPVTPTQQEQDEGPEGEDGPWAEGWEERSRPVANPFTPQEQDSREGRGDPITDENCGARIAEVLMDTAEMLGRFPRAEIDDRAWQHLMVYAPATPHPAAHVEGGARVTYRLLTTDDRIEAGDEVLTDDTNRWLPLAGWERGMRYDPSAFMPVRRKAQAALAPPVNESTPAQCSHENTNTGYDHHTCKDCGAFFADSGWGIARNLWFKSRDAAEFYKKNGRLPDPPADGEGRV